MADVIIENPTGNSNLDGATIKNIASEKTLDDIKNLADKIEGYLNQSGVITRSLKSIANNTKPATTSSRSGANFDQLIKSTGKLTTSFDTLRVSVGRAVSTLTSSFSNLNRAVNDNIRKMTAINVGSTTTSTVNLSNEFQNLQSVTDKVIRSFDILKKTVGKTVSVMIAGSKGNRGGGGGGGNLGGGSADSDDASGGASGAGGSVASLLSQFHLLKNISKLHPAVAAVYMGFQALSSIVGAVVKMFAGFVASGIKMVSQFVQGENKLSAYVNTLAEAVSSIPLIGGLLGGLVGIIAETIKTLEHWRDVQNQLADVGAAFNQDLYTMRLSAERTGLDLDKFAGIVSKNSENLSKFGTVTTGALQFTKVVKGLRTQMQGMGYGLEDVGEGVAQTLGLLGTGAANKLFTDKQLIDSSEILLREFDALAKFTGQSRKAQADIVKKQTMSAAFQMELSKMAPEQRAQIEAQIARFTATMGETGAEMVKLRVLGMLPFTREQQLMTVLMKDSVDEIYSLVDKVRSTNMTRAKFEEELDETTAKALSAAAKDSRKVEVLLKAAAAGMGPAQDFGKIFDSIYANSSKFIQNGIFNKEEFKKAMQVVRAEQAARDKVATSLNAFEKLMSELRVSLFENIIKPLLDIFGPALSQFAKEFGTIWAPKIKDYFMELGTSIREFTGRISAIFDDGEVRHSILESFTFLFRYMMLEIKRATIGMSEEVYQANLRILELEAGVKKSKIAEQIDAKRILADSARREAENKKYSDQKVEAEKKKAEAEAKLASAKENEKAQITESIKSFDNAIASLDRNIKENQQQIAKNKQSVPSEDQKKKQEEIKSYREISNLYETLNDKNAAAKWKALADLTEKGPYDPKQEYIESSRRLKEEQGRIRDLTLHSAEASETSAMIYTLKSLLPEWMTGGKGRTQEETEALARLEILEKHTEGLNKLTDQQSRLREITESSGKEVQRLEERIKILNQSQLEGSKKEKENLEKDLQEKKKIYNNNNANLQAVTHSLNVLRDTINFSITPAQGVDTNEQIAANLGPPTQGVGQINLSNQSIAQNRLREIQSQLGPGAKIKQSGVIKRASLGFNARQVGTAFQGEAVAGGEIKENTIRLAKAMAKFGTFTAFNDIYHQQLYPDSEHAKGKAFDIQLTHNPNLAEFNSWGNTQKSFNPNDSAHWTQFLKSDAGDSWMKNLVNRAKGNIEIGSIKNEYKDPSQGSTGDHLHVAIKRYGSIGTTGRAFENFGSATPAVLHGVEGVFTPSQLKMIVTDSQTKLSNSFTNNIKQLLDNKNQTQLENITNIFDKTMAESASTSKKLLETVQSHREETSHMKTLLSDMLSALNKSNNHLNNIARTV